MRRHRKTIIPPPEPLDTLLVDLNNEMGGMGVQQGKKLFFFATNLAYKVWMEKNRYFVTRISLVVAPRSPESIPLLCGSGMNDVRAILSREPFFLTPAEAAVAWAGQKKYDEDYVQFEQPFIS